MKRQAGRVALTLLAVLLAGQVVAAGWGKPDTPAGPLARHRRGKGAHRAAAGLPRIARPSTARHALGRPVPEPVAAASVPAPRLPSDAPLAVPA